MEVQHSEQIGDCMRITYVDNHTTKKAVIPFSYINHWKRRLEIYGELDMFTMADLVEAYNYDLKNNLTWLLKKSII